MKHRPTLAYCSKCGTSIPAGFTLCVKHRRFVRHEANTKAWRTRKRMAEARKGKQC